MKRILLYLLQLSITIGLQAQSLPEGYSQTQRTKTKLNTSWKFHLGDPDAKLYTASTDDSNWEEVSIPHTLELTSLNLNGYQDDKTQPSFQRKVGWYRKTVRVEKDPQKKVFLEFEGVHQVTDLWINGRHVGQHSVGGYTPFVFDISAFVKRGAENQITVLADNRRNEVVPPDPGPFDYIKFSGLYRDVYLVETSPLRITFNIEGFNQGITITTPTVDPVNLNATIDIKTVVRNESKTARKATVVNRVVDQDGIVVLKLVQEQTIAPGADATFNQIGGIEDHAHLWSVDDPYLYKVNTIVLENGQAVDCIDNPLGLRKLELDAETGFKLNGKTIELIGFNRHQHYGFIGDAMPNSLHWKDMLQFKQMGFNVVRTAHYPQDDALVDACDRLGILVYEEPPTWINISQNPQWYDNEEQAARTMVRNHRNHPSVIIWGAGINHRGYVPQTHYAIKQEDATRLTASQSSRWAGWQTSGLTDIFANMNYAPGIWNRQEPLLAMEGHAGPEVIAEYKRDPMMPGMISWTAHAYYTFHDIGNMEDRTRSGAWDSFRYIRNTETNWYPSELTTSPMVYIDNEWISDTKLLTIYSNCDEIELLVNGKPIGKYKPSKELRYQGLNHPPFHIPVKQFVAGKLTARGVTEGRIAAEQTIYTPGEAKAIRLTLDTLGRSFVADGSDILVAYAEVIDENGMIISKSDASIQFSADGNASIVGDKANISSNPFKVKRGVAPVLIQAGITPGEIIITASSYGLKSATAKVHTIADQTDMIDARAYPIYDNEKIRVDIGAEDQLLQFGWTAWNGTDNEKSTTHFNALGGFDATLEASSSTGIIRWLGEMNVICQYGFVYGEGVLGVDSEGLKLEFSGIKAGKYRLKTYHHAPNSNTDSMDPNREKLKLQRTTSMPYAESISESISDADGKYAVNGIAVSSGKERQFEPVSTSEVEFRTNGNDPVTIVFKAENSEKGIWLNGFELRENKNQ